MKDNFTLIDCSGAAEFLNVKIFGNTARKCIKEVDNFIIRPGATYNSEAIKRYCFVNDIKLFGLEKKRNDLL